MKSKWMLRGLLSAFIISLVSCGSVPDDAAKKGKSNNNRNLRRSRSCCAVEQIVR